MGRRTLSIVHGLLLAAGLAGTVLSARAGDWESPALLVVLTALAVISDAWPVPYRGIYVSGGFISVILAMALLGPAAAVVVALLSITVTTVRERPPWWKALPNFTTFTVYPLAGGLLLRALDVGRLDDSRFAIAVFVAFVVSFAVNVLIIVGSHCLTDRTPLFPRVRSVLAPFVVPEAFACVLTIVVAVIYRRLGFVPLVALTGVVIIFQMLARELLLSHERAEQLEIRTTELATTQLGVLAALVHTLSMRDRMTARHSAAVARYARAIAEEIGLTAEEQERAHTAGLLHDIGKFAFPDRILLADRKLDEEDWRIVRTHPYQGARLIRSIDGYGPVAEIILAHHERIDGKGYPRGLVGEEIPILARIISVADSYDVMTSRDSYRKPIAASAAIEELERVSGSQLDAEVVQAFLAVLERRSIQFQHTTDADFERELDFEARVRGYAVARAA
jgi:putative nucleotidyltransferase with HDIG domain